MAAKKKTPAEKTYLEQAIPLATLSEKEFRAVMVANLLSIRDFVEAFEERLKRIETKIDDKTRAPDAAPKKKPSPKKK